jgi:signal peptidase I
VSGVDDTTPRPYAPPTPEDDVSSRRRSTARTVVEWVVIVLGAVVVALLIRTFVAQAFYIPSESMEPALERHDRVVVNKLTYDFDDVSRGDVIVVSKPPGQAADGVADLIKRVVGVPGDTLVIQDGAVYLNGSLLREPYLPPGTFTAPGSGTPLPGADGLAPRCGTEDPCVVPDGHVFVMGDNRSTSKDSRWTDLGYVSSEQLVGRAFVRVWPINRLGGL